MVNNRYQLQIIVNDFLILVCSFFHVFLSSSSFLFKYYFFWRFFFTHILICPHPINSFKFLKIFTLLFISNSISPKYYFSSLFLCKSNLHINCCLSAKNGKNYFLKKTFKHRRRGFCEEIIP